MKHSLIADVSVNGKLLVTDNPNHPLPEASINFYIQKVIQAGNVIIGRNTLAVFQQNFGGIQQLFPGTDVVVLSTTTLAVTGCKVVQSPENAVHYLQKKGFDEIIIGGGTQVYNVFLNRDMVTDIYFNYIPVVVGDGGLLGTAADLFTQFELLEHKVLGGTIVQLHLSKV